MNDIVILDGGLGNSLFQLNYAWRLTRNNQSSRVNLFSGSSIHPKESEFLDSAASELGLRFIEDGKAATAARACIARSKRSLSEKKLLSTKREALTVTSFVGCRIHAGYWQTIPIIPGGQNTFDDVVSSLLPDGNNKKPIVHIRGGDYLSSTNADIYTSLGSGFYREAFSYFEQRLGLYEYDVVSNDPAYATDLLSKESIEFALSTNSTALEDFITISQHRAIVASNSTFCWWATRIGLYKGQAELVVAPEHWLNPGYRHRSHPSYFSSTSKVVLKA